MTKQDVKERMNTFIEAMKKEKEIKEKLLTMHLRKDNIEELETELLNHDQLIEEIKQIREKEILPIIKELTEFVSKENGELRR